MAAEIVLPKNVTIAIGTDPVSRMVQLALVTPDREQPVAVIAIEKATAIVTCMRIMAAVESLDAEAAAKPN